MDRKKTIVTAVMINAGVLTVLFIAAMTMREEAVPEEKIGIKGKGPQPLFQEPVAVQAQPMPTPVVETQAPSPQSVPFALPPLAAEDPKTPVLLPVEVAIPAPAPATLPIAAPALVASNGVIDVEVQKGDSLDRLAKRHHTTVDEIIKLNQLPTSFLRVGQRLKIPAEKSIEAAKPKGSLAPSSEQAEYYTMKVGDNPWSIAMKHHIKVDELLKLNGLNEKSARKLKPGDRLRIK